MVLHPSQKPLPQAQRPPSAQSKTTLFKAKTSGVIALSPVRIGLPWPRFFC
jgi:hypothetical protein